MRVLFSSTSGLRPRLPDAPARAGLPRGRARRALGDRRRRRCRWWPPPASRRSPAGCRRTRSGGDRAVSCGPRPNGRAGRRAAVRVPAHVRCGADAADGRRPAGHRPGLASRPDGPRERELASPLVGAVLGVPSVTHAFGGAVPAGVPRRGRRAAGRSVAGARPGGAAVRRLLRVGLPRHLPDRRCSPCRSTTSSDVQPLRPVADTGATRRPTTRATTDAARLRDHGHRPEPRPDLRPDVVAAWPRCRCACWSRSGPDGDPAAARRASPSNVQVERWVDQPQVLRAAARSWSRTAGRAPSSARWPRGCRSCACRRPPTSSATPTADAGPEQR